MQYLARSVVAEAHVIEIDIAVDLGKRNNPTRIPIFGCLLQYLVRALQASHRFGKLRSNLHDLHHRRYEESHEQRVGEEAANGQRTSENLPRANKHNDRANHSK